jgi:hypothetical protein
VAEAAKATDPAPTQPAAAPTTPPDVAPAEPVKATPPRSEGIAGAPAPSETVPADATAREDQSQPVKAGRAKATPAKRAARKTSRPTPAKAQPAADSSEAQAASGGPATTAPRAATPGAPKSKTGSDGDDRTGAQPIPAADPKPATDTPPAEEKRAGAEPIPPAEDRAEESPVVVTGPSAETPAETDGAATAKPEESRVVATRPPAQTPAEAEAAATTKPVPARSEPWAQLVADPGHAPELLALAAVQTIGPRAAEWAARHREAYPAATPDALARLAVRQFTRFGSVSSVFAAVAGSYAPITLLGSNALTYAEIVLHVAAAYGQDPTDRERAVDLLVLAQVHPSREDAEAALATAEQPAYEDETRLTDAVWRLGRMVAAQAAAWAVLKGVNRFFPGTSMLAAIMTSRSGARNMGGKATAYYRARA